jgi:hypothetical protein
MREELESAVLMVAGVGTLIWTKPKSTNEDKASCGSASAIVGYIW